MAELSGDHPALAGLPLVLGGNVFGWTIGRDESFAVLDAFYEAGGRMIDTAEGYSNWVPGNKGGESEEIIGEWLESRGVRADMRIGTKTGQGGAPGSLEPAKVRQALEGSLERLRTDYVDLYYAHRDDGATPLDDVVGVYDEVFRSGKVRELGASNYTTGRLSEVLSAADRLGARAFSVLQPLYNLVERTEYEGPLQELCLSRNIAVMPYYGLAAGFLTGKYRSPQDWAGSSRAHSLDAVSANGGWNVLAVLLEISAELCVAPAQAALSWLNAQPGIAAPIASATTPGQVTDLAGAAKLRLSPEQIGKLGAALADADT